MPQQSWDEKNNTKSARQQTSPSGLLLRLLFWPLRGGKGGLDAVKRLMFAVGDKKERKIKKGMGTAFGDWALLIYPTPPFFFFWISKMSWMNELKIKITQREPLVVDSFFEFHLAIKICWPYLLQRAANNLWILSCLLCSFFFEFVFTFFATD